MSAALLAMAAPVAGQTEAEIGALEARRNEITAELGRLEADLGATEVALDALDNQLRGARVDIELLADDFEQIADARREPARTRVQIAIVGFTNGDPRQNALIDEVLALQGSDANTRTRELYGAVIDDAQKRLEAVDEQLRALAAELVDRRAAVATVLQERDSVEGTYTDLGQRRAELNVELEDTIARIERLKALENKSVLTGLSTFDDPTRPVLAIKIDNVAAARPQSGINQADIIYTEEVEGGLTRFAAIFHSSTPAAIGPVRSMRTGDFDLLGQFNSPLFANSGGNRIARRLLRDSTLVDIGAATHNDLYYRSSRRAPHNLYTNPANLWSVGVGDDYPTGLPLPIFRFRLVDDPLRGDVSSASGVDIDYGKSNVSYTWNGAGWDRSQDGAPTIDADGVRSTPTTVIVQFTYYGESAADQLSPEADTVGQGEAWILTDGKVSKGFWRRTESTAPMEYVDASGNFIEILPGQTWIEMPRVDGAVLR